MNLIFPAKLLTGSLEINVSNIVTKIGSLLLSRAIPRDLILSPPTRWVVFSLLLSVIIGERMLQTNRQKTSSPWFEQRKTCFRNEAVFSFSFHLFTCLSSLRVIVFVFVNDPFVTLWKSIKCVSRPVSTIFFKYWEVRGRKKSVISSSVDINNATVIFIRDRHLSVEGYLFFGHRELHDITVVSSMIVPLMNFSFQYSS